MKLTKVDNLRIAVDKYKNERSEYGRGILYPVPNKNEKVNIATKISQRVQNANKLYNVFFKYSLPGELEEHFIRICKIASESKETNLVDKLQSYTQYTYEYNGRKDTKQIARFSYMPSAGKDLDAAMRMYVLQRMESIWQKDEYCKAAVAVLKCICSGKDYGNKILELDVGILKKFMQACKEKFMQACKEQKDVKNFKFPYVDDTGRLEELFTLIMRTTAEELTKESAKKSATENARGNKLEAYYTNHASEIEQNVEEQITFLKNLKEVSKEEKFKKIRTIQLDKFSYPYADDIRMNAILVRMRKVLKRGTHRQVVIALLQGLAGMNNQTLQSAIETMEKDPEQYEQLKKFINAVNKDYHRINIATSIKNIDVKVQTNSVSKDETTKQLDLSSVKNDKKKALNETLERYASSQENSDRVLLDLKTLLFEYFSMSREDKERFLTKEMLWKFPKHDRVYFDSTFQPYSEKEETQVNFEKTESKIQEEKQKTDTLKAMWEQPKKPPKDKVLKKRIRYVNYGKYMQMSIGETDAFRKYWITFVKNFIEEHYVEKKQPLLKRECYNVNILTKCWKQMIRFLGGKYIDIGKAVYHFGIPENLEFADGKEYNDLREEYMEGISSFDLEIIKAEETRQRDIATAVSTGLINFSRAALDYNSPALKKVAEPEDILTLDKEVLQTALKPDAEKQVFRFYGGKSSLTGERPEANLISEIKSHFSKLRNSMFHYTSSKNIKLSGEYAEFFMKKDREIYQQVVRRRYYSNNAAMFYKEDDIVALVKMLYSHNRISEAQIPAFKNVWKRKEMFEDLLSWKNISEEYRMNLFPGWRQEQGQEQENNKKTLQFNSALYYLLKEIYYRDFIFQTDLTRRLKSAVDEYVKKYTEHYNKKYLNAGKNFQSYLKNFANKTNFGIVCQAVTQEYNQQNAKEEERTIYKHFKMLLPLCIKNAFIKYVSEKEEYAFLRTPTYRESNGEPTYLDKVDVKDKLSMGEDGVDEVGGIFEKYYEWYTLAHFISPRRLNLFIGDLKNYMQFRQDIFRRAKCAGQFKDEKTKAAAQEAMETKVQETENIVRILGFVLEISGRVSNNFADYYTETVGENESTENLGIDRYDGKEEYAKYLMQYIDFGESEKETYFDKLTDFCQNTLPDGAVIDIYTDAKNPKVLRNIELARMYGGGDSFLQGHKKITKEELCEYYGNIKAVEAILSKGLCEKEEEQQQIKKQEELRRRLTLHNVTELYALINDLLAELISLSYLRERDQLFMLLGFYYMALRSKENWKEELDDATYQKGGKDCTIKSALVLYQVVSVFDYGFHLYYGEEGKWKNIGGQIGKKIMVFYNQHEATWSCAIRLFEYEKYEQGILQLRKYVDHTKYYMNYQKSLLELYNDFYAKFFGYSEKLRKSVLHSFQTVLERYFVLYDIEFANKKLCVKKENLKSEKFTYKLKNKKTVDLDARDDTYLEQVRQLLEYKRLV